MEELYKILRNRAYINIESRLLTKIIQDYESRPYKDVHEIMDSFKRLANVEINQAQIDDYVEQLKKSTKSKFPMCEE